MSQIGNKMTTSSNSSIVDNRSDESINNYVDEETLLFLHENMQISVNAFSIPTVTCGALMSCVAAAGIIGNILNVYIFSMRSMGVASMGVLLTGLSAVDAVLLLVAAPLFASSAIYVYRPSFRLMTFIAYMTAYAYPCASTLQTASVWLMMLATMERWIAVCQPFLARTLCTRARARRTVLIVLLASIAYNGCRFWEYHPTPVGDGSAMMALPRLRENKNYIRIYVHWMYFVFLFAIPFLVLSLVNIMVVLTIRKARRDRRNLTRQQRKEHATAALMVIVAVVFMTCNSLAFVLNALELWGASGVHDVELPSDDLPDPSLFYTNRNSTSQSHLFLNSIYNTTDLPDYEPAVIGSTSRTARRHSNFFYFLIDLNNLLVMIHCSVNFLIYYNFSQRFRAHVQMYVLGRKIIHEGESATESQDQSISQRCTRIPRMYENSTLTRVHRFSMDDSNSTNGPKSTKFLITANKNGRTEHVKHIGGNGTTSAAINIRNSLSSVREESLASSEALICSKTTLNEPQSKL